MGFRLRFSAPRVFPHVSARLGHRSSGRGGERAPLRAGGVQRLAHTADHGADLDPALDASSGPVVETVTHDGLRGAWTRCCALSAHDTQ